MDDITPTYLTPFMPIRGSHGDVDEIPDELFLDLHDGAGTQLLVATCYGLAVTECVWIGDNHYILKVRPDFRSLLYSQLQEQFQVFKLHRFPGPERERLILTENLSLQFEPGASQADRRTCLELFFSELPGTLEDGVYTLTGRHAKDPLLVWKSLELDPVVIQACPVSLAITVRFAHPKRVDLLTSRRT